MTRDELEFQISQYLDGTLSTGGMAALKEILAHDEDARQLLAEYQKLHEQLVTAMPLPELDWDQVATNISSTVKKSRQPVVAGWIGLGSRLALAAGVVLVLGIGGLLHLAFTNYTQPRAMNLESVAVVVGPQAEPATGPVVAEITVGPSPALASRGESWRYAEGVIASPSHVELAGDVSTPSTSPVN